ncbi:MAG: hypothetical protein LIR50_22110 [Bacillota bacterium]|nr:hypothetical protein [Bacillota bacterium]
MAIIENAKYNSLPEQVEENKENIKKLDEAVAEIDPDAITAVIDQVATNTGDISNIKAEQITQNNNIGGNALAITSESTNRKALIDVDASGNTQVKAQATKDIDLYSSNKIHVYGDEGANLSDDYGDEVNVIKDNIILETTSHDLILNEDGTLKMDSNKIAENGHLTFENIYDKDGHKRFEDWDLAEAKVPTGVNITYAKASLSGTHIMFVFAGTIENGTVLDYSERIILRANIPQWIQDKLYPLYSSILEVKTSKAYNSNGSTSQDMNFVITKDTSWLNLMTLPFTANDDRFFRIQFDYIIDNE